MLPFEFTVKGPPVSHQTRNRARLQQWKAVVSSAAAAAWLHHNAIDDEVSVTITYYYEDSSPDVDNIIKPIQDALIGIVLIDDAQVVDTKSRKRLINGSYRIRGVSAVLLSAFADGDDFLHIKVDEAPDMEVLD
jgi:Holliday junction resolvase RusA-like endonuclease